MGSKKKCSKEGCETNMVKDDLCFKHFKEKHGKAPFPSGQKTARPRAAKARPDQTKKRTSSGKPRRVKANGHDHECEGCKALQLQIDDMSRAEKIMVAAGLVPAEKFEQARKIARELHG